MRSTTLAPLPADTAGRVLERAPARREVLPDAVGACEVPRLAGGLPLLDQALDLLVENDRRPIQDGQDTVDALERGAGSGDVRRRRVTPVEGGVHLPDQAEGGSDRPRHVEIVGEAGDELLVGPRDLRGELGARSGARV